MLLSIHFLASVPFHHAWWYTRNWENRTRFEMGKRSPRSSSCSRRPIPFSHSTAGCGQIGDDRCIVVSKIYAMVKWWFRVRLAPTPPLCIHTTYTKHTNTIIHRKEKKKWSRCQRTCPIDRKRSKQLLAAFIYTKGACLSQSRTHAFQTHPPIYWSYRQVTMPK